MTPMIMSNDIKWQWELNSRIDVMALLVQGMVSDEKEKKDGPGPVMVSETLCPAVHILGT